MSTKYTYNQNTDFGYIPDIKQLSEQLEKINDFISVSKHGDLVDVLFSSSLSIADRNLLESIIQNHEPREPVSNPDLYVEPGSDLVRFKLDNDSSRFLGKKRNEIFISKESQADYNSIKQAVSENFFPDMVYKVYPGVYIEDNPIILPRGATLDAEGSAGNTYIIAQNPDKDVIVLSAWCKVWGFSIHDAYMSGAHGAYYQAGTEGAFAVLHECLIRNCNIGVEVDGTGGFDSLVLTYVIIHPTVAPTSKGVVLHSGGQIISLNTRVTGLPPPYNIPIQTAFEARDPNTKLSLTTTSIYYCNDAIYMDNGAEVEITLLTCVSHNRGIIIGPNGISILKAAFMNLTNIKKYDIDIEATDARLEINSGYITEKKVNNPNKVRINARFHGENAGKRYQSITGDVHLGSVIEPTKVTIGEGKYNDISMVILCNDNFDEGTWVDKTSEAISYEGSTFPLFCATNIGVCTYIGSATCIPGIKINITTATTSMVDLDDIVYEYWNGSQWEQFNVMALEANSPYYGVEKAFISYSGKFNMRFGVTYNPVCPSKILNGIENKWIRMRIVNDIPSQPVAEYIKIHTNNTTINKDGFTEYFGDARSVAILNGNLSNVHPTHNMPVNTGLYMAKTFGAMYEHNGFLDGSKSSIIYNTKTPKNIDISFPIKIKFSVLGDLTTTGNVEFKIKYVFSSVNTHIYTNIDDASDDIGDTISTSIEITQGYKQYNIEIPLDIHRIFINNRSGNNHILWIQLERDATPENVNDTYIGNVTLVQLGLYYIEWCNGGHISSF